MCTPNDQYSGNSLAQTVARYARTMSATRRHIINPDDQDVTLCGGRIRMSELFTGDNGKPRMAAPWMVYTQTPCQRCERSATKRGIVADTRQRDIDAAHAEALDMGEAYHPVGSAAPVVEPPVVEAPAQSWPRIVVEQLDKNGKVWRTVYQFPRNEDEIAERLEWLERAYLMTATRLTVERKGQPDEVVGVQEQAPAPAEWPAPAPATWPAMVAAVEAPADVVERAELVVADTITCGLVELAGLVVEAKRFDVVDLDVDDVEPPVDRAEFRRLLALPETRSRVEAALRTRGFEVDDELLDTVLRTSQA